MQGRQHLKFRRRMEPPPVETMSRTTGVCSISLPWVKHPSSSKLSTRARINPVSLTLLHRALSIDQIVVLLQISAPSSVASPIVTIHRLPYKQPTLIFLKSLRKQIQDRHRPPP